MGNRTVYVVHDSYDMISRVFSDLASARRHAAGVIREYHAGGWTVHRCKRGRDWSVQCEQEGCYTLFLDPVEMEGGAE